MYPIYMDKIDNKKSRKIAQIYECKKCDYQCNKPSDYTKHIMTLKHINGNNDKKNDNRKIAPENKDFICNCGKKYLYQSGLSRHKKKCNLNEKMPEEQEGHQEENNSELSQLTNLVVEVVKQNQEFQKLIIEQNQKIIELSSKGTNIINSNNNNSHNKTKFNLNFFLNEQCKDALNISDFVNDLQVKLTDLENVGRLSYSEGISKIFINGLKKLDIFKRPIHCSDLKREVLYVKDKDSWEKENEEKNKLKNAIFHISNKNIQQINKWVDENPNCKDSESRKNNQYLHIVGESMGSIEPSNVEKIIHNISKEIVIDKNT
jgi:hypothetical protein